MTDKRHNKTEQLELGGQIIKGDLEILYLKNKMTQKELGDFYGVSASCIGKKLKKFDIKARNKAVRNQRGPNNRLWRTNPNYRTLHKRVEYHRGKPNYCEMCEITDYRIKYEWANISGSYLDVNDFRRLCRDCHIKEHPRERDSFGRFK